MVGPAAAGMSPQALGASVMAAGAPADAVAIEQRIRKQYETRLKRSGSKDSASPMSSISSSS